MRALVVFALSMLASLVAARAAEPPRLAVFDFEMIDTSLEGEIYGPRADEQERLMRVGDQLRKELASPASSGSSTSRRSMLRRIRAICRPAAAAT